jgi:hypothetical protein
MLLRSAKHGVSASTDFYIGFHSCRTSNSLAYRKLAWELHLLSDPASHLSDFAD